MEEVLAVKSPAKVVQEKLKLRKMVLCSFCDSVSLKGNKKMANTLYLASF
jgi:hypothetical protein